MFARVAAAALLALAGSRACSACELAVNGSAACASSGLKPPGEHSLIQVRGSQLRSPSAAREAADAGSVQPLNCSAYPAPLQVMKENGEGYAVRALDIESGGYDIVYRVPYSRTSPPFRGLNACGVGPKDNIAYCVVWMPSDDFFVVRFDSERLEFVARIPDWSYQATFNRNGTFYIVVGKRLYMLPNVDQLPGFQNYLDAGLTNAAPAEYIEIPGSGHDIVLVWASFEGTGLSEYAVSARHGKVYITSTTGASKTWILDREDPSLSASPDDKLQFGAGWIFENRVFFASNSGDGIYEVDLSTVDLTKLSVQSKRVGPSVETNRNDGMNCMSTEAPKRWTEASCVLWGEPHIRVFDSDSEAAEGASSGVVDMFDIGDYWLVRSDLISIQGRYLPTQWSNGQAATSALAVGGAFLEDHVLIIESMSGEVWWDGDRILGTMPSEFSVPDLVSARFHGDASNSSLVPGHAEVVVRSVDLELPRGVRITVNRWTKHIDVMITMRPQSGGQDGHCGNFNGDASDDTAELLRQRLGGQVQPGDLLFPERSPERDGDQRPPSAAVTLEDCPQSVRARAELLCSQMERAEARAIERSCVFDVCFGGEEYAHADVAMDKQVVVAQTPVAIRWSLHSGMCFDVGGGQPLSGSVLQVWGCVPGHADMQFLLPAGGVGQIRWATYPNMCLDVARGASAVGTRVQIWECEAGHRDMQFILPSDGKGQIRWAADPTMCLDVREGEYVLGTHIQLWKCMGNGQANQVFEIAGASA